MTESKLWKLEHIKRKEIELLELKLDAGLLTYNEYHKQLSVFLPEPTVNDAEEDELISQMAGI